MLTIISESKWVSKEWHEIAYDDGHGNGFGFPCDKAGNPSEGLAPAARENLAWCRSHPERFMRAGKVIAHRQEWKEPATGRCICGERVVLTDQYMGACQCGRCGRWYSLAGEDLLPPEMWGWDGADWDAD